MAAGLWQYVLQSVVCVLGAVRRVTVVTRRTAPSATAQQQF
jgi:hypothetical protein